MSDFRNKKLILFIRTGRVITKRLIRGMEGIIYRDDNQEVIAIGGAPSIALPFFN
jgi:hypothetical protein